MRRALLLLTSIIQPWPGPGCTGGVPLPQRAIDLNAAGARALELGDLSSAEASLSVALEYSARFVEAWVNLGYVELRRGNFEQAGRDFARARDLNPDLPAPHHALGLLADKRGQGDLAEKHYRAALAVDPGFAPARVNLARRLFARGQYEDAREQFQRLERVAPDVATAWAGHAETLLELGRVAEAEAVVEQARERVTDAPALMLVVGRLHLFRGEWDEAETVLAPIVGDVDRALACSALAWIAVGRVARGDSSGAVEAARAALAIDGQEAVAAYALRRAQAQAGREGPRGRGPHDVESARRGMGVE